MKKKILIIIAIMLVSAIALVGCASKETTLSFETNGGSAIESMAVEIGANINAPSEPTREGYVFGGWYSDEALTKEYVFGNAGNTDVKLYAKWIDSYSVTLIGNGGEGTNVAKYGVASETALPTDWTRDGYAFSGWYANCDFSGESITAIAKGSKGDKTFYAKWDKIAPTYRVNLVAGNGAIDKHNEDVDAEYTNGAKVTLPTKWTRAGYDFLGWYDSIDYAGEPITSVTIDNADINLYAKWVSDYAVTLNANGGVGSPLSSYAVGDNVTLPVDYIKDGYRFGGWYASSDLSGDAITSIDSSAKGDKTFYAKWDKLYKVNLVTGEGDVTYNEEFRGEYIEGEEVILPSELTKVGYTFGGWYGTPEPLENDSAEISFNMGTSDVTLYAKWNVKNHFVTLQVDEIGGELPRVPVAYGQFISQIEPVSNASRDVAFDGWYYDAAYQDICTGLVVGDEDITLYGKWSDSVIDSGYLPYEKKFAKSTTEYIQIFNQYELARFTEYMIFRADKTARYHLELMEITSNMTPIFINNYIFNSYYPYNTNSDSRYDFECSGNSNKVVLMNHSDFDPNNITRVEGQYNITQIDNPAYGDIDQSKKRADNHTFAYESYAPSIEVENSSQLFYALQYHMKPVTKGNSPAEQLLAEAEGILRNIITDDMSDVAKAYAIYSWIIDSTAYDHAAMKLRGYGDMYTAFNSDGVFDNGIAVCDGISKAYTILANVEGLTCVRVISDNHAWNKVYLDADGMNGKEWYIVDCTWGNMSCGTVIDAEAGVNGHEMLLLDEFLITDSKKRSFGQYQTNFPYIVANTKVDAYSLIKTVRDGKTFDFIIEDETDLTNTMNDLHYVFNKTRQKPQDVQQNAEGIMSIAVRIENKYVDQIRGALLPEETVVTKLAEITKEITISINEKSVEDIDIKEITIEPMFTDANLRKDNVIVIIIKSANYVEPTPIQPAPSVV